ncbi:hypothetical protein GM182_07540 [bacterium 3DAC]|nr:hypothetical protein GM182_07540 [bacterium 3DAC]
MKIANMMKVLLVFSIVVSMIIPSSYAYDKSTSMPLVPAPHSGPMSLEMTASVSVVDMQDDSVSLKIAFYLKIKGENDVELTFNTSQRFDYWLKGNDFSYHYADGKMFLQVITPVHVKAGETISLGSDTVTVPYGVYQLDAKLMAGKGIGISGIIDARKSILQKTKRPNFTPLTDVYRSFQIQADVKSYIITDGATVAIDFYVKNVGNSTLSVSGFHFDLDILGGHASYMAYTSQYDKDQYLHFISGGMLTLAPGEQVLVASFRWDQNANVRSGRASDVRPASIEKPQSYKMAVPMENRPDYYPTYIVILKNQPFQLKVDGLTIQVPSAKYHMAFPLYFEKEMKMTDIPKWLEKYVKDIYGFVVPASKDGIVWDAYATRNQVLWGVFMASGLEPISVVDRVFADVRPYYYMESVLQTLKDKGIVVGYPDGTVRLLRSVTRAESVVLMIRVLEKIYNFNFAMMKRPCRLFKDMTGNEWYAKYVCYGEWIGLVSGYPDGTFRGRNHVKVSELAKMLGVLYKTTSK